MPPDGVARQAAYAYNYPMSTLILVVSGVILAVALLSTALIFNHLIRLRNRAEAAWHGVETELKRRYDLIPVLASTVKGYASHENAVFESAAAARTRGMEARSVPDHAGATDQATISFSSLFAVAEAYPDLRAAQGFRDLQRELSHTESVIANARKYYNASVMHYDNARQGFPGNLVAGLFDSRFPGFEYLEFSGNIDAAPNT